MQRCKILSSRKGQTVTVSYTDPTDGDDASANAIQDGTGNDAVSFTVEVRNAFTVKGLPGTPEVLSAAANGSTRIDPAWTAPTNERLSAISGYRIEWPADGKASRTELVADNGSSAITGASRRRAAWRARPVTVSQCSTAASPARPMSGSGFRTGRVATVSGGA